MDLLYVHCTLEHYDTTTVIPFSGEFYVDTSENSFKVVGAKEEHKFFANEFNRLGRRPSRASATQFSLDFNIARQPPARHHIRKRRLVFRTPEYSQIIKGVYDELKKIFPRESSPTRETTSAVTSPSGMLRSVVTSPVGMLRSQPDTKVSRTVVNSRPQLYVTKSPRKKAGSRPSSKVSGTTSSSYSDKRGSVTRKAPIVIDLDDLPMKTDTHSQSAAIKNVVTSEKPTTSKLDEPSSCVGVVNVRPSSSVVLSKDDAREPPQATRLEAGKSGASDHSPKSTGVAKVVASNETSRRPSSSDMGSQGSVIALVENKMSEKCAIKVTAPFKPRSHTITFKNKYNSIRSPADSSLANRLAQDFTRDQGNDDDFVNGIEGISSPSFYNSSRTPTYIKSNQARGAGEIISPRPHLLADSVSSSRCLLSPSSRKRASDESSPHISSYLDATTPSRKRKDFDSHQNRDDEDVGTVNIVPTTPSEQPSPYAYRGLENLTNSCYMNATLQALASVYPFYYRMQVIQQRQKEGYQCSEFVKRFNDVLQNLVSPDRASDSKYGSATQTSVLEALKAAAGKELGSDPDFGSSVQQDAHEFLAKTLEILEKEALRLKKFSQPTSNGLAEKADSSPAEKYISPISSSRNPAGVFQHKIRDRYGCERCARASEMTNDAIDLTVTVSAGESIQKMIEHALAREEIEYKCDNCGPGSGFISRAFATLPQSLIIVVKRYRFGEAGGSKVDEKIGVSRELFLKDLYVDSEVKRQEGVARQSVPQSLSHCIGNGAQNGYLENSGKASQMSVQVEGSVASQDEAMTTSSASFLSTDQEENNDYLFEESRTSDKVEKCISASCSAALEEKTAAAATFPVSTPQSSPLVQQRVALSPLKMNRSASVMLEKGGPPSTSRKLSFTEAMEAAEENDTAKQLSVHREKENVFGGRKDVSLGIEAGVIKQSGGYLEEDLPEKEKPQSNGAPSRLSSNGQKTHSSTSSTSEGLEQNVDSLHIGDDVPKKKSRMDGAEDCQAKDRAIGSANTPNCRDGLYARMITEPLRPSSRPSSTKSSEQPQPSTPSTEQISVLGEFEEKTTLIFRPVTEDVQKGWCSRFGFKYIGSPDLRKRTFGREVEFSLRDMPLSCEVRGDGNCLFRTLSWWITGGNEGQHFKLREKLVSFMAQYCSKFSSLLQSQQEMEIHLQRMSEDGEWGTQVELAAAACWLGVNIYTYLEGKWLKYRPLFLWSTDGSSPISLHRDECKDDNGAIFICNASGCHFQPAISVEPHAYPRRNLRPRKDREAPKDPSSPARDPDPPYVFNASDGPVYSLAAVICHHGDSLLSGHYSTFSLDATRREWLDCNDSLITKASEVEVIDNSSSVGYIFIYNRVEDPHKRI